MNCARCWPLAIVWLAGCLPTIAGEVDDKDSDTGSDSDTGGPDTAEPDTGGDTGGDTGEDTGIDPDFEYDCDDLSDFNLGDETFNEARAYHGIAFDDDGKLIGWDGRQTLVKSSHDGDREAWLPGMGGVEQIALDESGDLFVVNSDEGAVLRITPDGGSSVVANGLYWAYGITIGPDGNLYVSDGNVWRIDPVTGDKTLMVEMPADESWWAHNVGFSLDSETLFIGTVGEGELFALPLDHNLDPDGELYVYAMLPGGWMDTIAPDACGNLWVPEYFTSSLFKVTPDGSYTNMIDRREAIYGHGAVWGRGVGGWRPDAVYAPEPYNNSKVREIVIGVPDGRTVRTWNGTAVNL